MNTSCTPLSDRDMITDMLSEEKYLCGVYSTYASEAGTPDVHRAMMTLLNDSHTIQNEVWQEMHDRGWYPTEKAEDQKLQEEKMKYAPACTDCKIG